ncbi:MAG: DUF2711 family protein [Bacteroidota bacterium]
MKLPSLSIRLVSAPNQNVRLMDYWGDCFEAVFILFKPFFKLKSGSHLHPQKWLSTHSGNLLQEALLRRKRFDQMILHECRRLSWEEVRSLGHFASYEAVADSLMVRPDHPEHADRMADICRRHQIFYPYEDEFSPYQLSEILHAIWAQGYRKIWLGSDLPEQVSPILMQLQADRLDRHFFQTRIAVRSIYPEDHQLLFTNGWDQHETFVCGPREILEEMIDNGGWEGFFADESTMSWWNRDENFGG